MTKFFSLSLKARSVYPVEMDWVRHIFVILLLIVIIVGCNAEEAPSKNSSNAAEPKTLYGKSIQNSRHIQEQSEERDRALKEQADGM